MENKRQGQRIKKHIKSEVTDTNTVTFSTTQNISPGGIFISTPDPLKIGSEVEMSLYFPGEEAIKLKGIVRWTNENDLPDRKCGMGIEFVNTPGSEIAQLAKKIDH